MVYLRILHAKNQHPRPKTVAYRPLTDTHTDTQTDRQTEKANTEDPFFDFFSCFRFSFEGAVRYNFIYTPWKSQKLWPTGTHRHTDRQTHRQRKQTLRTPFFETTCIIYHLIIIGPCPGQRRVQPCITLENRLKNDRLMRTQTHRHTDRHTDWKGI